MPQNDAVPTELYLIWRSTSTISCPNVFLDPIFHSRYAPSSPGSLGWACTVIAGGKPKTGIEGGRTFALHSPYWFSLDLGYDYYWGKSVKENYSIFATAGHGGYFSPDIFYIYGPFLRYASDHCRDYWFDGQISLGYMHYETEDAPHYYETHDVASDLNGPAENDFTGRYESDTESDLGVAVKLQGLKFINDHAVVGGGVSLDSTSEYTEWQAFLTLRLYFQPRKKLCSTKDLFKTLLP